MSLPEIITLRDLYDDPSAVFSVMAMAGYLNAVPDSYGGYLLSIPNLEMRKEFRKLSLNRFHPQAYAAFMNLFNGMEKSDTVMMKKGIDAVLRNNVPFILLSKEENYQLIMAIAAMCLLGRYYVRLEKESGNGRADIIFIPACHGAPNVVMELKKTRARSIESMKKSADEALIQIKERKYFSDMTGRTVIYGICFHGKESAISAEELEL